MPISSIDQTVLLVAYYIGCIMFGNELINADFCPSHPL
jgi:hypothetical protein